VEAVVYTFLSFLWSIFMVSSADRDVIETGLKMREMKLLVEMLLCMRSILVMKFDRRASPVGRRHRKKIDAD
jgi:hypothetical protein